MFLRNILVWGKRKSAEINVKVQINSPSAWSQKVLCNTFCTIYFNKNKPNLRVKRAWVETPGAWISFFVSGPPFTPYQEFLLNFECLYRIQRPRKPPETRFCDLKMSNNAIIVKIVVSEVDFRVLQTNDLTNRAMQLKRITRVLGLSSVKIAAQSVRYLALHLIRTTTRRTRRRRRRRRRWNKHPSPYES